MKTKLQKLKQNFKNLNKTSKIENKPFKIGINTFKLGTKLLDLGQHFWIGNKTLFKVQVIFLILHDASRVFGIPLRSVIITRVYSVYNCYCPLLLICETFSGSFKTPCLSGSHGAIITGAEAVPQSVPNINHYRVVLPRNFQIKNNKNNFFIVMKKLI